MIHYPHISGDIDAYEFHAEVALHFHCDDCGEHLECSVLDSDVEAPRPPWATREGRRGMMLGWYVPPLSPDGSLMRGCLCPSCARKRGLEIFRRDEAAA